jgi:hypothetical protein
MTLKRPVEADYPDYVAGYVSLVPETDVISVLAEQTEVLQALANVPPALENYAYASLKWTIRQVAGHLGDIERVFGYRALVFGRGDTAPLPGFDENAYVSGARFTELLLAGLVDELVLLRQANLAMFARFGEREWNRGGLANGRHITVRGIAFALAGHARHHFRILQDKYGVRVLPSGGGGGV